METISNVLEKFGAEMSSVVIKKEKKLYKKRKILWLYLANTLIFL